MITITMESLMAYAVIFFKHRFAVVTQVVDACLNLAADMRELPFGSPMVALSPISTLITHYCEEFWSDLDAAYFTAQGVVTAESKESDGLPRRVYLREIFYTDVPKLDRLFADEHAAFIMAFLGYALSEAMMRTDYFSAAVIRMMIENSGILKNFPYSADPEIETHYIATISAVDDMLEKMGLSEDGELIEQADNPEVIACAVSNFLNKQVPGTDHDFDLQ